MPIRSCFVLLPCGVRRRNNGRLLSRAANRNTLVENKTIAQTFKLLAQLMELHGENTFRTKAMASVAFKVDKLPFASATASPDELAEQPGIGKSTAAKIVTIVQTGGLPELDNLSEKTPSGVLDMLNIKGLGPKKVRTIWRELGLESIGELLYACNENRLIEAKGFGLKTQEDIRKAIEFSISNQGWLLYAKVLPHAEILLEALKKAFPFAKMAFTGDFRRKMEVIDVVDILTSAEMEEVVHFLSAEYGLSEKREASLLLNDRFGVKYRVLFSTEDRFFLDLLLTTGSEGHVRQLRERRAGLSASGSEERIYEALGLGYIEPELREGLDEIALAESQKTAQLIVLKDLKGALHNHSTYSDGVHSLEQMALYCKNELGLEYFGICDHSKSAVYARGLTEERVREQWAEIDRLNRELAPFKIFKGIESDILGDGSLDYPDEVLSGFDFVVASIHSNLKMDEERATKRLLKAIENPYTTILGHPTGRLLLSRPGYPVDFQKIIDACAANRVAIEINANPLRLDLDWRWHRYALEKGVLLSINPDAHRMEGLLDMQYGVHIARKGGLTAEKCLNAFSRAEIERYFGI